MSYVSFHSRIKERLETLSGLKKVYGYEPSEVDGYPSASVTAAENTATPLEFPNHTEETEYVFRILIFDDLAGRLETRDEIEIRLMTLADTVLSLLRNTNFSDIDGHSAQFRNGGFRYIQREIGHVRAFEVLVGIKKLDD